MDLESELEALFGLPLPEFTASRNALAKKLKAAGRPENAAEVQALRKPSVSAWVVNQVARSESAAMDRLLELGEEHRAAVRAGRGAADLTREKSTVVQELLRAAQRQLAISGSKLTPALRARISRNLEALAALPAADGRARLGRLSEDLEVQGFDAILGAVDLAAGSGGKTRTAKRRVKAKKRPSAGARRARSDAEKKVASLRRELKESRASRGQIARKVKRLEAKAERLQREAAATQRKAETAREAADEAALGLREARAELDAAARSVERTDGHLSSAQERLRRLD